ncbi:MAG: hypothetical protein WC897_00200 [Candidatus Gracilibacteria bacterium]
MREAIMRFVEFLNRSLKNMRKYLIALLSLLLVACTTSAPIVDEGASVDNVNRTNDFVILNGFEFDLPDDWVSMNGDPAYATIQIPDYESYELYLKMDISELDANSLPSSTDIVKTTDEGVQIYNIGCGGPFSCGNLAYDGKAYEFTFELISSEPAPENLDGIWVPHSSIAQDDIAKFIETVTLQ